MSSTWNDDYVRNLEKQIGDNLEKAAIFLKGKIKEVLNVTGNPYRAAMGEKGPWYKNADPSQPGEPPHKMLGDLMRSIAYEMSPDRQAAFVGTNLDYGFFLEIGTKTMAARPYLRATMMKEQDTISKIVATGKAK